MHVHVILEAVGRGLVMLEPLEKSFDLVGVGAPWFVKPRLLTEMPSSCHMLSTISS